MTRNLLRLLPVSFFTATVALSANTAAEVKDPANFQAGPVFFTPTLDTELGYVDNLFRSETDAIDTGYSVLKPRIQAWMANGPSSYSLTWEIANYTYFSSHTDDFTDNTINLDIHQEFNAKNELNVIGEYYSGHEQRGTGLSQGIGELIDSPVELDRSLLGADYTYGSKTANGRLKLAALARSRDYQNFEENTQYRNYNRYQVGGTFFWRVGAKTDILAELRYLDTEYDKTNPGDRNGSLDSGQFIYFVGIGWDASAKVSGSIRVGAFNRSYESDARQDDDSFSWEIDLTYKPRTYSWFNLESYRKSEETNGLGNAVNINRTTLLWNHNWNTRSSTVLKLGAGKNDYVDSVPERNDDLYNAEARYNYAFRRWLDFGVGYRYEDRSSTLDLFNYGRNEVFLRADFSF